MDLPRMTTDSIIHGLCSIDIKESADPKSHYECQTERIKLMAAAMIEIMQDQNEASKRNGLRTPRWNNDEINIVRWLQ